MMNIHTVEQKYLLNLSDLQVHLSGGLRVQAMSQQDAISWMALLNYLLQSKHAPREVQCKWFKSSWTNCPSSLLLFSRLLLLLKQ